MRSTIAAFLVATSTLVSSTPIFGTRQSESIGRLNIDGLLTTCHGRENEVIQAINDMHLLTDAVKGVGPDDLAFQDYFGSGWDRRASMRAYVGNITANIQKAAGIIDGTNPGPTIFLTCEVLPGSCSQARTGATTIQRGDGPPRIVLCPFLFDTSNKGAHLRHVIDITPLEHATTEGRKVTTWEQILLHELMHIKTANYITFNPDDDNKISDLRLQLDNLDEFPYPVYGSEYCHRYAQFRSPPLWAPSNADSYAWFATAKYFRDVWGTRVTRAFEDDQDVLEDDDEGIDPAGFCASQGKPETPDCLAIDLATDSNIINLDSGFPCFSNGNRNWCDIYTEGNCQVSIGWDGNDGKPSITNSELSAMVKANIATKGQCTGHVEDKPKFCAVAQGLPTSTCSEPWKFCMKRMGVDCL